MTCEHIRNEPVTRISIVAARWCPDCGAIYRPPRWQWEFPADQPAPTETTPQGAHIDPIESGRPGKVAITNAPQGAPIDCAAYHPTFGYCRGGLKIDGWRCKSCSEVVK